MLNRQSIILIVGISICLQLISVEAYGGPRIRPRIFRGETDEENEYRFHVAILKVNPNETTEHICGGAIIAGRYVLTAAHCVYEMKKETLLVRSGWNVNPSFPQLEKRSYHKIVRIMYPKDYHNSTCRNHQHDIAILNVKKSFDLSDDENFKKVHLPERNSDYEGYDVTFTGYGAERISLVINRTDNSTVRKSFKYPEKLKFLRTAVIPLEQCKQQAHVIVTNENICTRGQNPSGFSCIGDSGGPLVYDGVIIGIRNSHNTECIHKEPEVFTRVTSYLPFIRKVLNHEISSDIVYL